MANYIFDNAKEMFAKGLLNFNNPADGLFRIALVTSDVFTGNNINNKTLWSDISNYHILNNSSYSKINYPTSSTEPGSPLKNVGISKISDINNDGYPDIKVYADDIVYNASTIDADGAVIIRGTSTSNVYDLICALDFGVRKSSNNGAFRLKLSSSSGGFLTIK